MKQRKYKREKLENCEARLSTAEWSGIAQVIDISEGGMKIDIQETPYIKMHEEARLNVTLTSGQKLDKQAVVVWYMEKMTPETGSIIGLKFI